jgi:phospholipase/carboxylesterase
MSDFSTPLFHSLWIPASPRVPRSQQKVLIVLHGRGDSANAYMNIKQELRLPNMNYLVLEAPRRYSDGYTWCALDPKPGSPSLLAIRARLFALIAELKAAGWKSNELFWMGHSQGCLVASDLVLHHPDAFGALIGVSGYIWFPRGWKSRAAKSGASRTPWLMTHGSRDRIIPPSEIRGLLAELARGPIRFEYEEFAKGHDFDFKHEVPFIRKWIATTCTRPPLPPQ